METGGEFIYLGDRVSVGCEAAVTTNIRCGWVKSRVCCDLLYCGRFPLMLKGADYESHVWPVILFGSEAWCLRKVRWEF